MKKLAIIAFTFILISAMLGCAAESAADRVLAFHEECLSAYDTMEHINLWAMQWINAFYAEPSFDSLLRADAAASAAVQAFQRLTPPKELLPVDDLTALFAEGADVVWIGDWDSSLSQTQNHYILKFTAVQEQLLNDAVYLPFHDTFVEKMTAEADYERCSRLSVTNSCNYLLLQLGRPEETWNAYRDQYPYLFADRTPWCADEALITQAEEENLNAIDEYAILMDRWTALYELEIQQMEEALNDDIETPLEEVLAPKDAINRVYPQPLWYCLSDFSYYAFSWIDDKNMKIAGVFDDLTQTPDCFTLKMPKVTKAELQDYADTLGEYGFTVQVLSNTNDEFLCQAGYGSCPMVLSWNPEKGSALMFLHGAGCMIPEWMLFL